MTEQEEIEYLKNTPPAVPLTRRDRIERVVGYITAAIAIAALVLAILVGLSGVRTSNCINANLGTRSAPSRNDAEAHIAFANAVLKLFDSSAPAPVRGEQFHAAAEQYKATLVADQRARDRHPLGKC